MNKEEIEEAKEDLQFFNEGDYITKEMSNSARVLEKYMNELEQKSETLDKAKEFVTKISTENAEKYNSIKQKEVDFSEWNLADGILNIIEGGKK